MSETALGVALVAAGYLCGSIPFGYLLTKLVVGVDVRTVGSGNIGGTNAARAGGKKLGVAVILLDAAKAILPILVARAVLPAAPASERWVVAVAFAAFVGHLFPVWLRFRGGKGVATALGIFVVLAPAAALAAVVGYAVGYGATRISSVGSLTGTAVCVAAAFAVYGPARPVSWAALALGALVFLRHRANIRRILSGEEQRKMRV
jgi:glycerol-3-phosphate acyltransferase PlsY